LDFSHLAKTISHVDTALRGNSVNAANIPQIGQKASDQFIDLVTRSQIHQVATDELRISDIIQSVKNISPKPESLIKHFSFTHFVELMRLSDPRKRG